MMINYPNKKSTFVEQKINHSNRGMSFENMINETNEYYLAHNIAVIHKKPIPIQIVKVDYPSRSGAVIKEAYYKVPSTTDYNGIFSGKHIDFEAKESTSASSFPLSNIHPHQIEHLARVSEHGGISFILIFLKKIDQVFLLETKHLMMFVNRSKTGRKSISITEIKEYGHIIKESYAPRIDYLKVVQEIIKKG